VSIGGLGRLEDKVAIVTGSARGIGRGIAEVFAKEGAKVVVADVDPATGVATADTIAKDSGKESRFIQVDVSRRESVEALVADTVTHFGRVDILAHNAGIYPFDDLENLSDETWDRVLDTNLKSALFLTQACLPSFRAQGGGKIVFTASITGPLTAIPGCTAYGSAKAGLVGFMRHAALELVGDHINVNSVWPGNILTEGMTQVSGEEYISKQEQRIPSGKLGEPADIGYAMLFLVTDEAKYITGQSIIVDGGQTLPEA